MKPRYILPLLCALVVTAFAASPKSYQVTGPVLALSDTTITVEKGDEKWEIARSAATKVDGKLAVGARVTVHYRMSAESIEVKEAGAKSSTEKADRAAEKASQRASKKSNN